MMRRFYFAFAALIFFAIAAAARAEPCAVCGEEITSENIYLYTDKVTNEKKHVCESCSRLTDTCFVCGMPVKKNLVELPDGRVLCARDARNAVLDASEAKRICADVNDQLDRLFSRFTEFPTNVDVAVVDRVNLVALFKMPGNDFECPNVLGYFQPKTNYGVVKYHVSLMNALPRAQLKATCAHELSHAWVVANVPTERRETLARDAEEGFCELISFLLMDSEREEDEKKAILRNNYTRGQIDLFIAAERAHGLNDVLDWMRWGTDAELDADEPGRIRVVEMPKAKTVSVTNTFVYGGEPTAVPDTLVLKGISGVKGRQMVLINDRSFAVGESGKVRVAKTNILIRCLQIGDDSARIQIIDSGEQQELSLKKIKP
jgi:hypothetical protein